MQQSGKNTALGCPKARVAFATLAAGLLASCVVYTPDLLNDDAVSLERGTQGFPATPAQAPTARPQLQLAWAPATSEGDLSFDDTEADAGCESDAGQPSNDGSEPDAAH